MKKMAMVLIAMFLFPALCAAGPYPESMLKTIAAMKADAEAKKEMPATLPHVQMVNSEQAYKLFKGKAVFLDNRVKSQVDAEKITGATWFFCDTLLTDSSVASKLDKGKEYVVYCNGIFCWRSPAVAMMLKHLGFEKVYWYRDGLPDWKKRGYPTE